MIVTAGKLYQASRRAYTMIEIMTVMAIISIVSSVVLPVIDNFYSGMRVKATAEIFVQSIRQAKYRAIQQQGVHRLIFSPDRTYFKLQCYGGDLDGSALDPSTSGIAMESDYDSPDWETIADFDEVELDAGVRVNLEAGFPDIIYFWINGNLVTDATHTLSNATRNPIGEFRVSFVYGGAAIRIVINSLGVLSSESYAADDDTDPVNDEVLW